ncbi:hypothetical protein C8A00DRAFT_39403 [Chaetomidium leptoderma]|uniref:Store-operated calcium entry-associated regulatory factor n=1 Tax=Chaetomidium leptoderma TaxID=669021 RepID=A0AAN6VYF4_9PEZI|nr:hypothetical protein C8A00DRAFT_39403 [Chaetomidium leptoderma]
MRVNQPTTPLLLLSLLSALFPSLTLAARPKDAILLSEVQSLTLRSPSLTTARRVPAIPQLKCLSSRQLCRQAALQTMRCTNQGASYTSQDIEWACTATLPATVRLDRTEVICEGYASADDAYVLRGSCGVEYTLVLTEEGRMEKARGGGGGGTGSAEEKGEGGSDWAGYLFGLVFFGVVLWIVISAFMPDGEGPRIGGVGGAGDNRRGGGGGGGGGGGWGGGGGGGGWNDPPPPYPGSGPKSRPSSSTEQGWQPGFWSGLAGGAAAGYMAGNRGQRNNDRNTYGRGGGDYGGGSGSWGGGSGSGSGWGNGESSSSSSGSSARHESTGYGSTSRR